MQSFSTRVNRIKASPTLAMAAQARELKQAGIDVIDLSGGEPDFNTPSNVCEKASEAMVKGYTKYTAVDGCIELKQSIQRKLQQENNLCFSTDEIIVSCGAKQVIFNAMLATLNSGDEVIIPAPYWVSYPDIVLLAHGTPVILPSTEQFRLCPKQLEAHITHKTKWVILNSPNNPTGVVYTQDELTEIAAVLRKYPHLWIMSDDIYEHIVFENHTFYNIAMIAPDLKDRILIVNGVSKSYAMTGWRIGYGAAHKSLIHAMKKIQSQSTSSPCSISQIAAMEALNSGIQFIQNCVEVYQKRRDMLHKKLGALSGIITLQPHGAFYLLLNVETFIKQKSSIKNQTITDVDLAQSILENAHVAMVPGSAFGCPGHLRISFANSDDSLLSAAHRLISYFQTAL